MKLIKVRDKINLHVVNLFFNQSVSTDFNINYASVIRANE